MLTLRPNIVATLGPFDTANAARDAILATTVFAHPTEMVHVGRFLALYLSLEDAELGLKTYREQSTNDNGSAESGDDFELGVDTPG